MGREVLQKVFVDKKKSGSLNRRELLWDTNSSMNSTHCEMNGWQLTFGTHSSHVVQLNTQTMWNWIQIVQFWVMTQRMNHPKTSPGQIHQSSQKPRWWGNQKTNDTQVTSGYNGRGTYVFHLVLWVCTHTHTDPTKGLQQESYWHIYSLQQELCLVFCPMLPPLQDLQILQANICTSGWTHTNLTQTN